VKRKSRERMKRRRLTTVAVTRIVIRVRESISMQNDGVP